MLPGPVIPPPPHAETPLTCLVRQLEQAQAGKLSLQIHVDYDWELPQEFPYDSEDELEEKVPAGWWWWRWRGGTHDTPHVPSEGAGGGADPVGGLVVVGQPWSRVSAAR